ncbi:hypothetical protein BDF14DRAFT_1184389 [Spinellus fusiger]|nr:hypothetical protein BDF14DRAFT_1184389 [Spinellus fusiger]
MSSTLTSSASSSRKRATTTQEPTTPTEKSKKAKKEPLSILKDFHFQPEVSQADIANALPPGTSSYLQSTVRGGSEAATGIKSDTVLPSSPLLPLPSSTPSHFTSPLPSLFLPSTPPTTTPHSSALSSPVSSGTIQPLPETSIPDVQASKTPIFKAPFPVSRATGLLPPPPSDKSTEMNPKEIGDHVTLANASDVSEMKAVIELSIKDGPSQILCKMGQLSDFTNDMINKVLASLEIILQSLKSHGNPISKLEKNLPISCLYGDMGGVHLESPLCFDSREKNLACLLVGVIDFCPDHESAYQYITKWASGKALFLTKEGKVNLACRYTRIMSLLCKKMEDIQRLRVFCYDVVRYSPLPTNYIGLLMNVAIVWPEVLSIHSQDFSQIGEEMIPKVVQSATAAYCKLHNSIETVSATLCLI